MNFKNTLDTLTSAAHLLSAAAQSKEDVSRCGAVCIMYCLICIIRNLNPIFFLVNVCIYLTKTELVPPDFPEFITSSVNNVSMSYFTP